jgi:hypothetical protein
LCEEHPLLGKLVKIGRLDARVAVATQIAPTLIIGQKDDNVRPVGTPLAGDLVIGGGGWSQADRTDKTNEENCEQTLFLNHF